MFLGTPSMPACMVSKKQGIEAFEPSSCLVLSIFIL